MRALVVVLLLSTLMISIQALPVHGGGRCLCTGTLRRRVQSRNILNRRVFQPSLWCDHSEIVLQLIKPTIKVCLNPNSDQGKEFLKKWSAGWY
ncbi:C-X-C motif chemokine 9 [Osmerus eperlanus]|uniref:C-X-C motif chemokine 9 n=1 Tax=Osmerus eperlanus TaxID=29151 RepID=UPI002E1413E3